MHEHQQFDAAIKDYERFNSGAYSHAEHVEHVNAIIAHGYVLLRALGAPSYKPTNDVLVEAAVWALQYFERTDSANATVHCAPVKYSPITFRLARALQATLPDDKEMATETACVLQHDGAYEEDTGR